MTDAARRLPCAIFLLLGSAGVLRAQTRPMAFERLSLEQGLSQSTVLSTYQDTRGFMWFGTEDGLDRYDGLSFRTYKFDPRDSASLPNNMVWAIVEDGRGDLWVGTEGGGVARWDQETDRFVRIGGSSAGALATQRVRALLAGPDGAIWIGTKDAGLFRLEPRTGEVKNYRHDAADPSSLGNDGVYSLLVARSGGIWLGTDAGLNRLDPGTGKFTRYLAEPSRTDSPSDRIRALCEDHDARLWVGTFGGGLNQFDPPQGRFVRYRHDPAIPTSLSHDRVRSIVEDSAGRLWVATDGGLDLMDRGGAFQHYRHDPTDTRGLDDSNVMSLYEDRGGILWVGTRSGGVHKWNPASWTFGHHTRVASDPSGLSEKIVTAFAEDRTGRIWIGTFGGGLNTMDRLTGQVRRYTGPAQTGLTDRVMALASDADGALWIGTMDAGLHRMDPATGTVRSYRHVAGDPRSLSNDAIMSLGIDALGDLWVGTHGGGLNHFDARTGSFTGFRHDKTRPGSLSSDSVTSIVSGQSEALWIGTDGGGLNLLDRRSGQFTRFAYDSADPRSLGSNTVYALHLDASGRLWVGTRGAGLAVLEGAPGASVAFRHFTQRDGLPNDVVYGILPDGDGQLWLSTNNGLARFDPRTGRSRNYDGSHGLQSSEFNFGAHYRSANGELLFGGVNGFNAFQPQHLQQNTHVPPVVLTSFLKFNRPAETSRPLWRLGLVDLGYRDEVVTFEFAALDYAAPQRNRYAYKLEGFDRDWVDIGNLRRVTYTNLTPGSYRFRVRAANNDGVWNEAGLDLPVHVEAPPWRRWWAYVAYVLAAGGALLAFVRVQKRKLEREAAYARRLEEDVEQRTQQLAARNADLEAANGKLAEASLTDSLTGLRNRRFLFEHVPKDVDLVRRRYLAIKEGKPVSTFDLSFLMIDLDHFKDINDSCGHAAGDAVLRGVREVLQSCCREADVLIRWGGDEFLLVGRDNDPEQVSTLAERVRAEIEAATFEIGEGRVARTTCSIGYACYPFAHGDPELYGWEDILNLADAALYAAKAERNAWVGYLNTGELRPRAVVGSQRIDPSRLLEEGALRTAASSPRLAKSRRAGLGGRTAFPALA